MSSVMSIWIKISGLAMIHSNRNEFSTNPILARTAISHQICISLDEIFQRRHARIIRCRWTTNMWEVLLLVNFIIRQKSTFRCRWRNSYGCILCAAQLDSSRHEIIPADISGVWVSNECYVQMLWGNGKCDIPDRQRYSNDHCHGDRFIQKPFQALCCPV